VALINLQTQQPSLKKSIVSSSVFRPSTPIASVAKIPFGGVAKAIGAQPKSLQVDKLDVPDDPSPLYGIIDALRADVQSLRQEQTETSEIIGDIGNALATDFANRITEEKAQNTKLNKERSKLRQNQAEKSVEKSLLKPDTKSASPLGKNAFGGTKGIFGKIFTFLATIVSGIGITSTIEWMKDNGKDIKGVFDGIAKHWKWIAAGLGALIAIDVALKIATVVSALAGVVALLSNPLVWVGIGLIIAATSTGVGNRQKEVLSELDAMGGPTKENRMLMIARLKEQKKKLWPTNIVGKQEIESKIKFLESGDYGSKDAFGKQHSINWDLLEESGNINKSTESRRVGGSITKGRLYRVHKDEIIKAPFTGTVERVGRAKQLISEGGGRITYIDLPAEVVEGKPPEIKTPSPVSTYVDPIASVNVLNPYMSETPSTLGIRV
tara:strand:+ start:53 stop:1366 length:1314 start_codon:yes stop_codon:yes gene_type:complete